MASKGNRGLLIGCILVAVLLGGFVVLIAIGGVAWFYFQADAALSEPWLPDIDPPPAPAPVASAPSFVPSAPPAPLPEPEAAPLMVMAHVRSTPPARVSEDGVELGTTPLDLPILAGTTRELRVESDGHVAQTLTVSGDAERSYDVALVRAAAPEPEPEPARVAARAAEPVRAAEPARAERRTERAEPATTGSGAAPRPARGARTGSLSHDDF